MVQFELFFSLKAIVVFIFGSLAFVLGYICGKEDQEKKDVDKKTDECYDEYKE